MPIVGEEGEAFYDTVDHLMCEEASDYDIWLGEPKSVRERRESFLSKMGFFGFPVISESAKTGLEGITESNDDNLLTERRKSNSEANCSVDYSDRDGIAVVIDNERRYEIKHVEACLGESLNTNNKKKKTISWIRSFTKKMKENQSKLGDQERKTTTWMKVEHNRKRYLECSGIYVGQELKAHNGLIWTMKFSPDGQFLASGGQDGVVCVWRVTMVEPTCKTDRCSYSSLDIEGKMISQKNKSNRPSIIIPEKIFRLDEVPVQTFKGHSSDVLDIAWSKSNHLLSSSMDKTVRLWHVSSENCLGVFQHSNYVTCAQFNPVDESFFISGSIDGKVRVWGIRRRRVLEWSNVRDIVTAVCYQPTGKGFVVGTLSGNCRFYELSEDELLLNAEINVQGKKRSSGNKITGIQFLNNDSQRLMITSEDSKIRILDGLEVVRKYKGLAKSGGQMSASFTSSGRHIVSIGEDSRVYFWNYDDLCIQTPSKQAKSMRSCESFFTGGVSVVLPWSDSGNNLPSGGSPTSVLTRDREEASSRMWDSDRFSLANWFTMDSSSRVSSMTWPEEKLPLRELPCSEDECRLCTSCGDHFHQGEKDGRNPMIRSPAWGIVFVTANWDGTIRTFHNYGLPLRV